MQLQFAVVSPLHWISVAHVFAVPLGWIGMDNNALL